MRAYCKAYLLKALRQFRGWSEDIQDGEDALSDDSVVYLWDDFTVVRSPITSDKGVLWNRVTPEWQEFCKTTLQFEIPEDLRFAYEKSEEVTS